MRREAENSGVKFDKESNFLGLDLLADAGPIRAWPGFVYTLSRQRIEAVIPELEKWELKYEVNFILPNLPPMPECFEWPLGQKLAELEGWHKPNLERS